MVNFSASIAVSPRSAGTDAGTNNSTTTGEAEGAGNGDSVEEKADATQQQREEAVRSMSSEGNPFDLDGKKPEAAHSGDGDGVEDKIAMGSKKKKKASYFSTANKGAPENHHSGAAAYQGNF